MDHLPTRRWWLTRIELAIGIGAVIAVALMFVSMPAGMMGADATQERAVVLVGLLGMAAGLAWQVRIYRGPRDERPRWHYRDR